MSHNLVTIFHPSSIATRYLLLGFPADSMIVIVGGPSGSGKSTIGTLVAEKLGYGFIEGDSLHPQANIDKMTSGIALTDDDRWGWLETVATKASIGNCVVSCSALKKSYRDLLLSELEHACIVLITPSREELVRRMTYRQGHFMKLDMLESQLEILEMPENEPLATYVVPDDLDQTVAKVIEVAKKMT